MTQSEPLQLPLGAVTLCQNMAQLTPGKLRRIPGIEDLATVAIDGSERIPLCVYMSGLTGNPDYTGYTIAAYVGTSATTLVNLTLSSSMSGPTLGAGADPWTHTFYAQKHIFAGDHVLYEVTNNSTYVVLTGTNVPAGNLVQSFLDRLYVSDITSEEGIVRYSDALTTDFQAGSIVNVKEIPGAVTALGVNSPSTDSMGIYTQLVIFKRNTIWIWDETSKDIVSQKIGTLSPHTVKNTNAGLLFLGKDGNRNSVFLMPTGTAGEPIDVGEPLRDILNGSTPLSHEDIANAAFDGRFYKLFFSRGTDDTNASEMWLDTSTLLQERAAIWYGPHTRGSVDMSCITPLYTELVRRGASSADTWFREKVNADSAFIDMDGDTLVTVFNMPLNVEPLTSEKIFDSVELQIPKEANSLNNELTYEPFSEGNSQGAEDLVFYQPDLPGIVRVFIPLHSLETTGMAGRDVQIKITHAMNTRFDIAGMSIQYLAPEDDRLRAQVLQETIAGKTGGTRN